MFAKQKKYNISWKSKNIYSLEYLKHLYNILIKQQIVTEINKDLLIETLRSISELLIWGDQNDPALFDFFLEKNMLVFFISIARQDAIGGKYLSVQLLQTLNILFENIRHETSLYYLLSNNHINALIQHKFDFSDEEVTAYYISFLKTLSLKLNQHTIHFFINEHSNEFPLYSEAIKFYDNSEPMVRIAVQTITLNIFSIQDPNASQHVASCSQRYFTCLATSLEQNILKMAEALHDLYVCLEGAPDDVTRSSTIATQSSSLASHHAASADDLTRIVTSGKFPRGDAHSCVSSPTTSPDHKAATLKERNTYSVKESSAVMDRIEDLITQHTDKLQYLDDVFLCKHPASPLCLALGQTLANTVFVPLYLLPFLGHCDSANPGDDRLPPHAPCPRLPIELATFLLVQCFKSFGGSRNDAEDEGRSYSNEFRGQNFVNRQLIHLIFGDIDPTQSIMYCVGMRPALTRPPDSIQDGGDYGGRSPMSEGEYTSYTQSQPAPPALFPTPKVSYLDQGVYRNILPDDRLSKHYLTLETLGESRQRNPIQGLSHLVKDSVHNAPAEDSQQISVVYRTLLDTLDSHRPTPSRQFLWSDCLALLTLTLFSKLLADPDSTKQAFLSPPDTEDTPPPDHALHKVPRFPHVLPPNMKFLVDKCTRFLEDCANSDLDKVRLVSFYTALNLLNRVLNLLAASSNRPTADTVDADGDNPSRSPLDRLGRLEISPDLTHASNLYPTYDTLKSTFRSINSMYSRSLETLTKRFKADDSMFLDVFENRFQTTSLLTIPPSTKYSDDGVCLFQSSSPLLLLNVDAVADDRPFYEAYKFLLSSRRDLFATSALLSFGHALFSYRRVTGVVERVKMEVSVFLLLRKFLDSLTTELLPLLSPLGPLATRTVPEDAILEKSLRPYITFERYYDDFGASCHLPDIGDVIDLSNKDIISCTIEKHLSKDMPYWFLVVSDHDFALVVPHHKKMAHGIIKYGGPLKDIEVAGVTNDPRSLYVRIHRLFSDDDVTDPHPTRQRKLLPTSLDTSTTLFKAKLSFEDVIRCQAAKNCLLKGRVRCRRSKTRLLGKMLYAADPIYLPSSFKSYLPQHTEPALSPTPGNDHVPRNIHSTSAATEATSRTNSSVDEEFGPFTGIANLNQGKQMNQRAEPYVAPSSPLVPDITLRQFTSSPAFNQGHPPPGPGNKGSPSRRVLPSVCRPCAEPLPGYAYSRSRDTVAPLPSPKSTVNPTRRIMPAIPGSARPSHQGTSKPLTRFFSPGATRKLTMTAGNRAGGGSYSTERFVRSLEDHSDEDDYYLYTGSTPSPTNRHIPGLTTATTIGHKPGDFPPSHHNYFSRSNSQGSGSVLPTPSYPFGLKSSRLPSNVPGTMSHVISSNVKDI